MGMNAGPQIVVFSAMLIACAAFAATAVLLWRARHSGPPHAAIVAELARVQSETAARVEALVGMLAKGQNQLSQILNERLDSVSHRLGDSLQKTREHTAENLQKL